MSKIKISVNGPYLVEGKISITEEKIINNAEGIPRKIVSGKKFEERANLALCRCGKSKNKPFCDGSHLIEKFNGKETASKEKYNNQAETITGPDLILKDAVHLCAGLGFCHRGENTWQATENSDRPKSRKLAIETANCCASGRLRVFDKKSNQEIEPKFEKAIGIIKDGPIWVKGGVEIESGDGKKYEKRNQVTLCRCGKSKNKPFCDGSHLR